MLGELSIRNFAIIESLNVSFTKGLTVLTGETGAGKSIIIDAIGLLIGGRGSSEFVRFGTNKAEIEGLFHVEDDHVIHEKCEEIGISASEGMVILKRDITESGKSVCRVNGKLVTLSVLKEFGQTLVDIHGQHETQFLMQPEKHLFLLDSFGGKSFKAKLAEYDKIYEKWKAAANQLKKWTENEQQMAQRLDLLQYQADEIEAARLQEKEDFTLQEEKLKLSNYEKLYQHLHDAYHYLYGDGKGLEYVSKALGELGQISRLETDLQEKEEQLGNAYYLLEELSYQLRDSFENLEFNPDRLNFIEDRLNEIGKLKRKYGNSVQEILSYYEKIKEELEFIYNKDSNVEDLKKNVTELEEKILKKANALTKERKEMAHALTESIHKELKELYMEKTVFEVFFKENEASGRGEHFTRNGKDDVEFYLSPNPGEPMKPLAKVASGGELSRVILAMKTIFSRHQEITAIIFDEVDTGVSGRVAQAIAEKIFKVAEGSQVLCITHLPQVAAMADTHLHIAKEIDGNRTITKVNALHPEEKIQEIGRMISGVEMTELTKEHAKELLHQAEAIKKSS